MLHLLQSLFFGYLIAFVAGGIAATYGAPPLFLVLGIWFTGSALSIVIAIALAEVSRVRAGVKYAAVPVADSSRSISYAVASSQYDEEIRLWDADLADDQFRADLVADQEERAAQSESPNKKAG